MAAAKFRVSDVAKKMGLSDKDLIFRLQSLGAEVSVSNTVLEPEVIQALITGKKLATGTRSVIMLEDKPQPTSTEPDDEDLHEDGGPGSCTRASSSRVEWSFGSPTMAVRPPYAATIARSGTDSSSDLMPSCE